MKDNPSVLDSKIKKKDMDNKSSNLILSLTWTILWWAIAWLKVPFLSSVSFFPLWLGFIFTINALSEFWFNDSLVRHLKSKFLWLFIISIPFWWGFEWVNSAVIHSWFYSVPNWTHITKDIIQASLDFSTVIPAISSVMYTAFRLKPSWQPNKIKYTPLRLGRFGLVELTGLVSLVFLLYYPHEFFPLVWITPLLILDPVNYILGFPSVTRLFQAKNIKAICLIAVSGLFTGFFWEMWNYYSVPKWYYHIPFVGSPKIFEMPILGYLGYIPFALLIWSYCQLLRGYKRNNFM